MLVVPRFNLFLRRHVDGEGGGHEWDSDSDADRGDLRGERVTLRGRAALYKTAEIHID
jgi:hypothetical protein